MKNKTPNHNDLRSRTGRTSAWVAIIAVVIILFLAFFFIIKAADEAEPEADRVVAPAVEATE